MNNKITIYRGSHQIGGCATEIKTAEHRIIIDIGSNLPGSKADNVMTDVEALGDKIILHRENFSFEDLLAQGAVLIPNTGYLKSVNKKVTCFFTEKRNP